MTYFTFEDTLTQIGLGYPIAFLLAFTRPRWQWTALAVILAGYWAAWALYPAPGPHFNYAAVGVPPDWHHNFTGFLSHWNKNSNLGQAFDLWFLNLFPREHPFIFNEGGYLTLSFIPTLGTMLLGLAAGRWIRAAEPAVPMKRMLQAAAVLIAAALLLHFGHICPIVKRIWTPAWTLFSGGVCFLFLAAFSWLIEMKGWRRWAFPLTVVGMNSIAAYLIADLFGESIIRNVHIHLGERIFAVLGTRLQPLLFGITVMLIYWLILYWMFRRKLFLRV
jgi:predicted acyltransferase